MLKSSRIILFCKTDVDFHQIATFILKLAVYSMHTVSFLDLTYSYRTLFYDTFDKTLLHLILVTAPTCGSLVHLGCKGNIWSTCFHTFIVMILYFLNNIMQDLRKCCILSWPYSVMTWGHGLGHFRPMNHLKLSKHVFL